MSIIPAGEFNMGKNTVSPSDWSPEHKVFIDSFYLDKYELSNKQYYNFCFAREKFRFKEVFIESGKTIRILRSRLPELPSRCRLRLC